MKQPLIARPSYILKDLTINRSSFSFSVPVTISFIENRVGFESAFPADQEIILHESETLGLTPIGGITYLIACFGESKSITAQFHHDFKSIVWVDCSVLNTTLCGLYSEDGPIFQLYSTLPPFGSIKGFKFPQFIN
jgi:hypothetical protein